MSEDIEDHFIYCLPRLNDKNTIEGFGTDKQLSRRIYMAESGRVVGPMASGYQLHRAYQYPNSHVSKVQFFNRFNKKQFWTCFKEYLNRRY